MLFEILTTKRCLINTFDGYANNSHISVVRKKNFAL